MAKPISYIFSLFTTLILLLSTSISAQSRGNIQVGSSLTATINGTSWVSPTGDFAFGFHQFLSHTNLFLLAIWYAKIPDTIVWYANEGNPVPQGSTVTLSASGGLILNDPQGSSLWNTSSDLRSANSVSHGFMNDTGNLILTSSTDNDPVWQSFEHPTDTLLPSQLINIYGTIDSRLSDTNFTKGRFQLLLQRDGNVVLNVMDPTPYWADSQPYFASGTSQPPNQGKQVIYNESGSMYIVAENGTMLYNFIPDKTDTVSARNNYLRVTLNFDGVLSWYYHPRNFRTNNEVGWSKMYSLQGNICSVGCGYNSICSYDNVSQSVGCECPSNYSLIDPSDKYGSCKPGFELWEDGQDAVFVEYTLVPLENTQFGGCHKHFQGITEEQCKSSCLYDRFCAVATWDTDNGGTCCKNKPFFSGANRGSDVSKTAWLKVGNGTYSTYPLIPEAKTKLITVISVLLGGSVFVNFALLVLGIFFFIYHQKQLRSAGKRCEEYGNVHCFSYKVLEEATGGFKEEVGRGAFGVVYEGKIRVGGSLIFVAVKKLDRISNNADKEFETEVNVIGKTHHKNLVRLVGFCKEDDQRLLVYEYMRNGSLADCLFGDMRPSWVARIEIAQGIAWGLMYLHEECSPQIIHCDIKPQNILLDDHQNALISDFGISKLLSLNQTHTTTAIRGTKGYVASEWFKNRPITVKVDVYSFGVLLLEIICCRKSICMELIEQEGAILTDWAFDCYQSNRLDSLVHDDMEALNDSIRLKRLVMVALWCVQEDPSLRPTMRTVTQMLEGLAEVPAPPCLTSTFTASY